MPKVEGRLTKFKVRPGAHEFYDLNKKLYFDVHIFEEPEHMYKYANTGEIVQDIENHQSEWGALTSPKLRYFFEREKSYVYPKIGNLIMWQGQLGVTVVCHEAVHVATSFLRTCEKLNLGSQIDENEEILAHCVGSVSAQIYSKLYKLKII